MTAKDLLRDELKDYSIYVAGGKQAKNQGKPMEDILTFAGSGAGIQARLYLSGRLEGNGQTFHVRLKNT